MLLALPPGGICLAADAPSAPPAPSLTNWMARLPDARRLSELSIPGTHDSGARHEPWPGTARCQSLSIAEQLAAGVRFLDIRCRQVTNTFQIYHGKVSQKISFADVLADCDRFLKAQPGECVILSVKQEADPVDSQQTFQQTFDSYTNQAPWWLGADLPALGEVRGRLVLFRRFAAARLPEGIPAGPGQWSDNTTFWIGHDIRVQDRYEVRDQAAKWTAVQDLYGELKTNPPSVLFLNFTSGYHPGWFGVPRICSVSHYIHPRLTEWFRHAGPGRTGVTLLDFADAKKCALIIGTNP
jgi:1-phosphatidylinositol phosphodiesterase